MSTTTPEHGVPGCRAAARRLVDVSQGRSELLPALAAYEEAMVAYGFEAVRLSRKIGELAVSEGGLGRALFKAFLRVVDRVPPLKERMFGARPTAE